MPLMIFPNHYIFPFQETTILSYMAMTSLLWALLIALPLDRLFPPYFSILYSTYLSLLKTINTLSIPIPEVLQGRFWSLLFLLTPMASCLFMCFAIFEYELSFVRMLFVENVQSLTWGFIPTERTCVWFCIV